MPTPAPIAAGNRIAWGEVPADVRGAVESALGSGVVAAETQHGGFSPGAAVRVDCADGTRAFVKACSSTLNPDSPGIPGKRSGRSSRCRRRCRTRG